MALTASVMLHILMLMALPGTMHASVVVRATREALSVTMETLAAPQGVAPIVVRDNNEVQQKSEPIQSLARADPEEVERSQFRAGVSVKDELFLGPIPSHVSSTLLASDDYHRTTDITEAPEPVAMKVPEYPAAASAREISGWVLVILFVDERGNAAETMAVESSESFSGFKGEVAASLRGSIYTPGKINGRAVKTLMFATIRFEARKLSGLQVSGAAHEPLVFGYRTNRQGSN